MIWRENNTVEMYCDGVLKFTVTDYLTNYKTGAIDYQILFFNLGLGTYDGDAPNGTGWFEITDYSLEPIYSKDREKQHYWNGNWTDGTPAQGTF